VLRKTFGNKEKYEVMGRCRNLNNGIFIICTLHQILWWPNQGGWDGQDMYQAWGEEKCIQNFSPKTTKWRDRLGDLGVEGR